MALLKYLSLILALQIIPTDLARGETPLPEETSPKVGLAEKNGKQSLEDCFAAALARAQNVKLQADIIRQTEEHARGARSTFLPNVSGIGSYLVQDPTGSSSAAGKSDPNQQPLAKISLTQSIFNGMRDVINLQQNEGLVKASKLDRDSAVIQLYKDVAQAFYTVITYEADYQILTQELDMYASRVKELEEFARKGRSRLSEVLTAKSGQATLQAQADQVQGQIETAREDLAVLTGFPTKSPLYDAKQPEVPLDPLEEGLKRIDQRPEMVAAMTRIKASGDAIDIARGAYYPSVNFGSNVYMERTGAQKDSRWDVELAVAVPIYDGGMIASQVGEAVARQQQGMDTLGGARNAAEQEIRGLYASMAAELRQIKKLEVASELAARSYQELTKEYRLGLVTNLDVLTSLQASQEAVRALERTRNALKLDREHYAAALAERPLHFTLAAAPEAPSPETSKGSTP